MTKEELIETVWLGVQSAMPGGATKIKRADIEVLLPSVINFLMVQEYRVRRDEQMRDPFQVLGGMGADPQFISTHFSDVELDETRGRKYVVLPKKLQSLPHGMGLDQVAPENADVDIQFHVLRSRAQMSGMHELVRNSMTSVWFEQYPDEQRLYFDNLSPSVNRVIIHMVASMNDIGYDEEIPVPDGVEFQAVQILMDHFTGVRALPDADRFDEQDAAKQ
jgi:hypothetical protein